MSTVWIGNESANVTHLVPPWTLQATVSDIMSVMCVSWTMKPVDLWFLQLSERGKSILPFSKGPCRMMLGDRGVIFPDEPLWSDGCFFAAESFGAKGCQWGFQHCRITFRSQEATEHWKILQCRSARTTSTSGKCWRKTWWVTSWQRIGWWCHLQSRGMLCWMASFSIFTWSCQVRLVRRPRLKHGKWRSPEQSQATVNSGSQSPRFDPQHNPPGSCISGHLHSFLVTWQWLRRGPR